MNVPIILSNAAKSIARILLKFNDNEFHLIRQTDLPGVLRNDFNYAVRTLEDLSFVEVKNNGERVFYESGETPDDSLKSEFEIKLLDDSIKGSL